MQNAASGSRSSDKGRILFKGVALLVVAFGLSSFTALAAEPVLTLAMARPDHRPERPIQSLRETPSSVQTTRAVPSLATFASESLRDLLSQPSTALLQKPVQTASLYPFALSRSEKNRSSSRWAKTSIEPGFGDLDTEKPVRIYGRHGTGWEEPSVGYIKVHLKF